MAYRVRYKRPAKRDIQKLNPQIQSRIKAKLEFFYSQKDPLRFAERLTEPLDAQYRWRIGDYRILFDVEENLIVILRVQHRRDVYRKR